jgi:hypothetical protein
VLGKVGKAVKLFQARSRPLDFPTGMDPFSVSTLPYHTLEGILVEVARVITY